MYNVEYYTAMPTSQLKLVNIHVYFDVCFVSKISDRNNIVFTHLMNYGTT